MIDVSTDYGRNIFFMIFVSQVFTKIIFCDTILADRKKSEKVEVIV